MTPIENSSFSVPSGKPSNIKYPPPSQILKGKVILAEKLQKKFNISPFDLFLTIAMKGLRLIWPDKCS